MKSTAETKEQPKPRCGIIMPMSAIDGCPESHWSDVRDIISDAIEDAGFEPNLVSDADDVGIIQKRIIQNVYENPIVVCDVSGKNPNVMFELGLRLAFDKPTVIVKDEKTDYSFDTSPIEHLGYPRDLRFNLITEFKTDLTAKLQATYQKSISDPDYTPFLKHFGKFTIAKLDTKEVPTSEFILEELKSLRKAITDITTSPQRIAGGRVSTPRATLLCLHETTPELLQEVQKQLETFGKFSSKPSGPKHFHLSAIDSDTVDWNQCLVVAKTIVPSARLMPGRK